MGLEAELSWFVFFWCLWIAEKIGLTLKISPVVSNILIGVILGPAILGFVEYSDAFKFAGKIGVMLLVTESGLGFNLTQIINVGFRGLFMAASGVILPLTLTLITYQFIFHISFKVN